jgi:RNA polymerase sigma-70 factor (ECF subfamily)
MAVSSLAGIDESALVIQSRDGDSTAFGELVRRYEGKIFRLAQHVTQNREDAEDVLQETFMKAYEHLDQFKGDSKFYTWIVRIAVNQALMKLRRRKTDKSVSLDETIDTGEDMVVREISRERSWAAFWRRRSRVWNHFIEAFSSYATSKSYRRKKRPKRLAFRCRR